MAITVEPSELSHSCFSGLFPSGFLTKTLCALITHAALWVNFLRLVITVADAWACEVRATLALLPKFGDHCNHVDSTENKESW
jgi:hypothetical protein